MSWQPPEKKPRSRKDMAEYLGRHFRYNTLNSWNNSSSYARCIKLSHLDIPKDVEEVAWDVVCSEHINQFEETGFDTPLDAFQRSHGHVWQWGTNGRSSGYVVLYRGELKTLDYKSRCFACGQFNFAKVVEEPAEDDFVGQLRKYVLNHNFWRPDVYLEQPYVIALALSKEKVLEVVQEVRNEWGAKAPNITYHNQCGRCRENERVNLDRPVVQANALMRGVDEDADFTDKEEWPWHNLQERVNLVWEFDQAVNAGIKNFIEWCRTHHIEEEEAVYTKTIQVAVPNE